MSVKMRPYRRGGWEADVRVTHPDGRELRVRKKAPCAGKSAATRWAENVERGLLMQVAAPARKESRTLTEFGPRFLEGYAVANRQKPSGIAGKESILRRHLVPQLGAKKLDAITNEDIQRLKVHLVDRAAKTVNNVLTVLNTLLRIAVEWDVISQVPCRIRLLPTPLPQPRFHDFDEFARLVDIAKRTDSRTYLAVLLGGEAGLRAGEIMALEWADVDFVKNQVCVERSDWKGHVTSPKGGRLRYVPLTKALGAALRAHRHLRRRVLDERDGRPLTQKVLQCIVRAAARRAGLKHEGLHVLRHTFCSHLAMRSAPARAIQELAGHKDLSTTQRYMHLSPAATVNVIRLLDDAQTASSLETCWRRERNEELKAATAKGGLPAVARNRLSQPTFAKATVGSLRVISERRLVEAAGVETDGFDSAKWLMANVFWAKVLIRRRFHPFTLSTPFHSVRRDSTGVLETIWRRTPMATRERGKADGRTFGVQAGSHDD